jgi:lipopolysaccharide transport system ATP-binding protein
MQFAAATAIHPDILVIDEVLGAGDAYFSGESAARMKQLTSKNCTLLLVSHSMQQILQFCQRCVWIESGKIALDGPALDVVRAYVVSAARLPTPSSNLARSASARTSGRPLCSAARASALRRLVTLPGASAFLANRS